MAPKNTFFAVQPSQGAVHKRSGNSHKDVTDVGAFRSSSRQPLFSPTTINHTRTACEACACEQLQMHHSVMQRQFFKPQTQLISIVLAYKLLQPTMYSWGMDQTYICHGLCTSPSCSHPFDAKEHICQVVLESMGLPKSTSVSSFPRRVSNS